jgi:hypothetical protein
MKPDDRQQSKLEETAKKRRKEFFKQQAELLLSNPAIQSSIADLRKELQLPPSGFDTEQLADKWKDEHWHYIWFDDDNDPEAPTDKAITKILQDNRLPSGWHHSLKRYLFLNNPDDMQLPTELGIGIIKNKDTGQPEVHIIINETTSSDDIVAEWYRVEWYKDQLPYRRVKKRQSIYNLKTAKRADELHKAGMKPAKIALRLQEEKLGNYSGYEISQLLKRYKNRVTKTT